MRSYSRKGKSVFPFFDARTKYLNVMLDAGLWCICIQCKMQCIRDNKKEFFVGGQTASFSVTSAALALVCTKIFFTFY